MRRARYSNRVTLFPFISVLACLMGAISVIIAGVSVTQMFTDPDPIDPVNDELERLTHRVQAKQARVNDLRVAIVMEKRRQAHAHQQRDQLERLRHRFERATLRAAAWAAMAAESHSLFDQITQLRVQREQLATRIEQLEQQHPARAQPPAPPVRDRIEVQFTGQGRGLKPVFVECTADGLVIHDRGTTARVRARNIHASDRFQTLLDRVKAASGGTVILLIRPDGISSFRSAQSVVQRLKVRNGKLPIPGEGELDFGPYGTNTHDGPPANGDDA